MAYGQYQPQIAQGFNTNYTQQSPGSFMTMIVNGEAGANAYPVAAGNTVLLVDFNEQAFWLKSTDAAGIPQALRKFTFTENKPKPPAEFVTKEEFASLNNKLDKLLNELGGK